MLLEDWLREKHPVMRTEDRAKLVHEYINFMRSHRIGSFDKMSPHQALQVFAALLKEEARRLTSLRQLVEMLAEPPVKDELH
jgi:hypothetical protein